MQVKKLTNDISYILDALRDSTVLEVQVVIVHCALAFNFIAYIKTYYYAVSMLLCT